MTYSLDFRKKVLSMRQLEKLSLAIAAKRFGIDKQTIFRWSKKLYPQFTRNKSTTKINMEELQKDINDNADAYQYERAKLFGVSKTGMWWALKRLGVTYKKNVKAPKSGRKKAYIVPKEDR